MGVPAGIVLSEISMAMSGSINFSSAQEISGANKICRLVIQQCLKAELKFDTEDKPVCIGTGMVVFVCFLQGASLDRIPAIGQ